MAAEEAPTPLNPGESAPEFVLPRPDQEGTVSLDDFRGRPLLITLMRGVQCPFCRRNVVLLGQIAPALRQVGVEVLAIVGTTAERARLYFRYRPASIALAADPELAIHRDYGIPCYPVTPELRDQYRATRVDPFKELSAPVPLLGPDGRRFMMSSTASTALCLPKSISTTAHASSVSRCNSAVSTCLTATALFGGHMLRAPLAVSRQPGSFRIGTRSLVSRKVCQRMADTIGARCRWRRGRR